MADNRPLKPGIVTPITDLNGLLTPGRNISHTLTRTRTSCSQEDQVFAPAIARIGITDGPILEFWNA